MAATVSKPWYVYILQFLSQYERKKELYSRSYRALWRVLVGGSDVEMYGDTDESDRPQRVMMRPNPSIQGPQLP